MKAALVTFVICIARTLAYSTGPPCAVIYSMAPDPNNHGAPPQPVESNPYELRIFKTGDRSETPVNAYKPCESYTIRLSDPRGPNFGFRGFMIQARMTEDDHIYQHRLGRFIKQPDWEQQGIQLLECSTQESDDTIMHIDARVRQKIEVIWVPARADNNIQFLFTAVETRTKYWVQVKADTGKLQLDPAGRGISNCDPGASQPLRPAVNETPVIRPPALLPQGAAGAPSQPLRPLPNALQPSAPRPDPRLQPQQVQPVPVVPSVIHIEPSDPEQQTSSDPLTPTTVTTVAAVRVASKSNTSATTNSSQPINIRVPPPRLLPQPTNITVSNVLPLPQQSPPQSQTNTSLKANLNITASVAVPFNPPPQPPLPATQITPTAPTITVQTGEVTEIPDSTEGEHAQTTAPIVNGSARVNLWPGDSDVQLPIATQQRRPQPLQNRTQPLPLPIPISINGGAPSTIPIDIVGPGQGSGFAVPIELPIEPPFEQNAPQPGNPDSLQPGNPNSEQPGNPDTQQPGNPDSQQPLPLTGFPNQNANPSGNKGNVSTASTQTGAILTVKTSGTQSQPELSGNQQNQSTNVGSIPTINLTPLAPPTADLPGIAPPPVNQQRPPVEQPSSAGSPAAPGSKPTAVVSGSQAATVSLGEPDQQSGTQLNTTGTAQEAGTCAEHDVASWCQSWTSFCLNSTIKAQCKKTCCEKEQKEQSK